MSTKTTKINTGKDLESKLEVLNKDAEDKIVISLCSGTGCKAAGADDVFKVLKKEIKKCQPDIDRGNNTAEDRLSWFLRKRPADHILSP